MTNYGNACTPRENRLPSRPQFLADMFDHGYSRLSSWQFEIHYGMRKKTTQLAADIWDGSLIDGRRLYLPVDSDGLEATVRDDFDADGAVVAATNDAPEE